MKDRLPGRYVLASLLAKDDLRLLKALRDLASAAGKTAADADAAYHQVQFELDGLRHRILRESRLRGHVERTEPVHPDAEQLTADEQEARAAEEKARAAAEKEARARAEREKLREHRPWHIIARLVRAKRYQLGIPQRRRSSEQKALERSLDKLKLDPDDPNIKLGPEDLTPVETRAVELVRGGKAIARKKNPIEKQAVAIATAVDADLSRKPKGGRPAARRQNIVFNKTTDQYELHLTAVEVVAAVLSTIEDLAGPANSAAPDSAMIAAVVAVMGAAGIEPKPMPDKIRAAGMTQKRFDEESGATIVRKVRRQRAKRNALK